MRYISYFLSEDDMEDYDIRDRISELKSTTKAALAGGGIGMVAPVPFGVPVGAYAGYKYKQDDIKQQCAKKFKKVKDQQDCYRFRNNRGRLPRNKKELASGRLMD